MRWRFRAHRRIAIVRRSRIWQAVSASALRPGFERMARYRLHCVGASGNAYKVALYLNCAGLDWEPVGVDFAGGQTRDANWRADTNAMGEVPVLEVGGKRMSQSGAILMWLSETTGNFALKADERFEALRWLFFDNHKFTSNYAMHRFQRSLTPQPVHPEILSFLKARVEAGFSIVDRHLTDRRFVLGDRPTIVDFSMAGYVFYPAEETGFDIKTAYPAIDAWRQRLAAMPGWKPPYELMPVGVSTPVRAV
jgi:glutathione S-transferase